MCMNYSLGRCLFPFLDKALPDTNLFVFSENMLTFSFL